jgi:lipoate-protein ligase A
MALSKGQVPWSIVEETDVPPGISEPAWNMGLDTFNLDCVAVNRSIPRMRLYQWTAPAITLGRFQDPDRSIDKELCRHVRIPIAIRPTGGRGILHGADLTVSLAASLEALGLSDSTSIADIYGSLSGTLLSAFAAIGLSADRGWCVKNDLGRNADCMATVSRADIVTAGSGIKLSGGALLRKSGCVLFQCTIPANTDYPRWQELQSRVFLGPVSGALTLPPMVPLDDFRSALMDQMRSRVCMLPEMVHLSGLAVRRVIDRSVECQIAT